MLWFVDDELGTNPTGVAGEFEFDVNFAYDPGSPAVMYDSNMEGHPGYPSSVNPESVGCDSVKFAGESEFRRPTKTERKILNDWFWVWLDSHPDEYKAMCNSAAEEHAAGPD
jgi:hypothetical protein